MSAQYQPIEPLTHEEALRIAESAGHPQGLANAIISLSLYDEDCERTTAFALRWLSHSERTVRGGVMISFDHLSRRFKDFFKSTDNEQVVNDVVRALKAGLEDADEWVRMQAEESIDGFEHRTGLRVR